jgi:hypothetical protein
MPRLTPRLRRRLIAGAGAALLVVTVATAISANAAVPPTPSGWSLVWSDDFNGSANTLPSSANWIIDTGTSYPGGPANWGTGEVQTFTNSTANLRLDGGGNLVMTPLRAADGSWTSSRLETQRANFKPATGAILRIESRIQMPNVTGNAALGYWPAFWALGAPYRGNFQNWPSIGEFDIMENVNGLNAVYGVLHCGVNPGGPCNETTGIANNRPCPGSTCQAAFHTYRFEWDNTNPAAEQLRWYVDGQQFHTINESQIAAGTWSSMTSHAGYFLLLDLAIGGAFPNALGGSTPTAATASGVPMLVDYVGVWQSNGTTPTTPPTTTSPPTGGTRDAYSVIQAESFNAQSGVVAEATTDTGGGQDIGFLANGDWAQFTNVNFGATSPIDFQARVASGAAAGISGLVEVRIDNVNNAPIGSFAIANTGGWQTWRTVPANVGSVTGTHTVFLRFTSGQPAEFVNVNWFQFRH